MTSREAINSAIERLEEIRDEDPVRLTREMTDIYVHVRTQPNRAGVLRADGQEKLEWQYRVELKISGDNTQ